MERSDPRRRKKPTRKTQRDAIATEGDGLLVLLATEVPRDVVVS